MNRLRRLTDGVTGGPVAAALHCRRHGHDWASQRPTRCVEVTTCRWCGRLGWRTLRGQCRWGSHG